MYEIRSRKVQAESVYDGNECSEMRVMGVHFRRRFSKTL